MYDVHKLIDRTCRFVEGMSRASKGNLSENVKVTMLMQHKQSLQWRIEVLTQHYLLLSTTSTAELLNTSTW